MFLCRLGLKPSLASFELPRRWAGMLICCVLVMIIQRFLSENRFCALCLEYGKNWMDGNCELYVKVAMMGVVLHDPVASYRLSRKLF